MRVTAPSKPRASAFSSSTRLSVVWTPPGLVRFLRLYQARLIASQTSSVTELRTARALSRAISTQRRIEFGLSGLSVRWRRALKADRRCSPESQPASAPTTLSALIQAFLLSRSPSRDPRRIVASTRRALNSARSM
jgi:hypothetical protein